MGLFSTISDKLSGLMKHRETDFDRMVNAAGALAQRVRDTWNELLVQYPPKEGTIVHEIPTLWNRPRNTVRIWRTESELIISTACLANLDGAASRIVPIESNVDYAYETEQLNRMDPGVFIKTHVIPVGSLNFGISEHSLLLREFRETGSFPKPPRRDICERAFSKDGPSVLVSYPDRLPLSEEIKERAFMGWNTKHTTFVNLHRKAYPVLIDLVPEAVRHSPTHQAECLFALGFITEHEYIERINKIESEKES